MRALDPMMAYREFFDVPICEVAYARLKFQDIWWYPKNWYIEELSKVFNSSFSAHKKFVALSERISEGMPLLAKKRRRTLRVASDDRSWHISR